VDALTLGVVVGDEMLHWGLIVNGAMDSGDVACESAVVASRFTVMDADGRCGHGITVYLTHQTKYQCENIQLKKQRTVFLQCHLQGGEPCQESTPL